ncbi:MAG: UDP-N-acetylmuramoyl-L-alanyl-D-glutamate--2,6-diaminopimelate ligase [Candidatus Omnitrophota bacterium]
MKNSDLFKKVPFLKENVKTDSRLVTQGDIFVAIKGPLQDGHKYIPEVFRKGAGYVLSEVQIPDLTKEQTKKLIIVKDTRKTLGRVAAYIFNNPSESLLVYGVTGTNGKTTTVFLIDKILNTAGLSAGFISTVFTKSKKDLLCPSSMTTPDVITLNSLLSEMVMDGKKAAVIEISSHALSQKRTYGIRLDSAVFTNISPEHLDYHKNMKAYLKDKSKIFQYLKPGGLAVINVDNPMCCELKKSIKAPNLVTFGINNKSDVSAKNIKMSKNKTEFILTLKQIGSIEIRSKLIGKHNVYNMLSAAAALITSGLDLKRIKDGLEASFGVPGRLEKISGNFPFRVFVDYAHTPNALENVLSALRPLTEKRLICVFGCGGNRDKTKREIMGQVASKMCDYAILTNDNPRFEDPRSILDQIEKGMSCKGHYSIIPERRGAIKEALRIARKNDVVVIAGKGHENYQIIKDETNPFSDKMTAEELLREMGYE